MLTTEKTLKGYSLQSRDGKIGIVVGLGDHHFIPCMGRDQDNEYTGMLRAWRGLHRM